MFLIDSLIASPGKAMVFLFESLVKKAEEELLDDQPIKLELQEIYKLLEAGQISLEEFETREARLLERLDEISAMKGELEYPAEEEETDVESGN